MCLRSEQEDSKDTVGGQTTGWDFLSSRPAPASHCPLFFKMLAKCRLASRMYKMAAVMKAAHKHTQANSNKMEALAHTARTLNMGPHDSSAAGTVQHYETS